MSTQRLSAASRAQRAEFCRGCSGSVARMAKAHTTWRVLPHGPIEKLSDRVWRVEGDVPGMPLKRVMTIALCADGGLDIHNAIALNDAGMAQLEQWGPVRVIVVPNGYHRLDAEVFAARFPDA